MGNMDYNFRTVRKIVRGGPPPRSLVRYLVAGIETRQSACSKRALVLCLVFLFISASLFSSPVEWSWKGMKSDALFFRYQADGEDEEGWTVVDGTVTSLVTDDDVSVLFVQHSADGVIWSLSEHAVLEKEFLQSGDDPPRGRGLVWSWNNDDGAFSFFRYRRHVDDEWTVVDRAVTSVTLYSHEGINRLYLEGSTDGVVWTESSIGIYSTEMTRPKTNIEELIPASGDIRPFSAVEVAGEDEALLSYMWSNGEGYNWFRFRLDDEPWYLVDSSTGGVVLRLEEGVTENEVFQIKASFDGRNWTERLTLNDSAKKYDEAYMDREGWILKSSFSLLQPYLVAFFTPAKGTINYTTPNELSTDSVSVSFTGEAGMSYETKGGNGYGFNIKYIHSPTKKGSPYTVTAAEFTYSRLLYRTQRYNTFQLRLEAGAGPSLCLFKNVGSLSLSFSLGISARFTFESGFALSAMLDNTVVVEPNFNSNDQLTLGTTFYTTLPLRIGIAWLFKEVRD